MGPEHHSFAKPVTIRIKNLRGLAPGSKVNYSFASHDEEDPVDGFYDPGTGTVTTDGQFIEYQVNHFSCMPIIRIPPLDEGDGEEEPRGRNSL